MLQMGKSRVFLVQEGRCQGGPQQKEGVAAHEASRQLGDIQRSSKFHLGPWASGHVWEETLTPCPRRAKDVKQRRLPGGNLVRIFIAFCNFNFCSGVNLNHTPTLPQAKCVSMEGGNPRFLSSFSASFGQDLSLPEGGCLSVLQGSGLERCQAWRTGEREIRPLTRPSRWTRRQQESATAHTRDILSKTTQRLSLRHLPTTFAAQLGLIPDDYDEASEREEHFDLSALKRMLNIEEGEDVELMIFDEEFNAPSALRSRSSRRLRPSSSATPDHKEDTNLVVTLARMEATLLAVQKAQLAFFDHMEFRYLPGFP